MFLSTAVSSLASMIRSDFKGFCSGGWSCFGTEVLACWVDFGILKLSYIPHLDRPIKFLLCAQNSMVLSKVGMLVMLVTTAHPHADTLHVPDPCVWMLLVNPLILLYYLGFGTEVPCSASLMMAQPASHWHSFRKLSGAGEVQQKELCSSCLAPASVSHLPGGVTFPRKHLLQCRVAGSQPGRMQPHLCPSPTLSLFPRAVQLEAKGSTTRVLFLLFTPCLHGKARMDK